MKRTLVFTALEPGLRLCDCDPALTVRVDELEPPKPRIVPFLEHPDPRSFPR